jgi:hypothetical protein
MYQNGGNLPLKPPKRNEIYQMAVIYVFQMATEDTKPFPFPGPPKFTQFGILV